MSAGVILVDPDGRVLMQLRDDNPAIMFPGHWGLTGGAAHPGETPDETARREVEEETGLRIERFEPFRAYYFAEQRTTNGKRTTAAARARAEYELYMYHAPCTTPAESMTCGEGRGLRFFAPRDVDALDIAYNHRDVLADFFASPVYARYVTGAAFEEADGAVDPVAHFIAELDAGTPWFDAMMEAIAMWECAREQAGGRAYSYLVGGEAFDWLLLAERLLAAASQRVPEAGAERLLFNATPPGDTAPIDDARLRTLIGEAKHRAHLNFIYGVTVEEALQYATELDVAKERVTVSISDTFDGEPVRDPVFQRIYGQPRLELLSEYRGERGLPAIDLLPLAEYREFLYWLFKYRVKHNEPARVASDTRKALAQLSAIEAAAARQRRRLASAETASD
jgi:8-oxo-dGTP pyrophosphatase MutT (NUDIX family)